MTYAIPGNIRTNIVSSTSVGGIDSPFTRTRAVLDMMKGWEIMKAVTEGTEYLRENSEAFLPLEGRQKIINLQSEIIKLKKKIYESDYLNKMGRIGKIEKALMILQKINPNKKIVILRLILILFTRYITS